MDDKQWEELREIACEAGVVPALRKYHEITSGGEGDAKVLAEWADENEHLRHLVNTWKNKCRDAEDRAEQAERERDEVCADAELLRGEANSAISLVVQWFNKGRMQSAYARAGDWTSHRNLLDAVQALIDASLMECERALKAERERDELKRLLDVEEKHTNGWKAEALKAQQERDDARQTMGSVLTDSRRFERERDEALAALRGLDPVLREWDPLSRANLCGSEEDDEDTYLSRKEIETADEWRAMKQRAEAAERERDEAREILASPHIVVAASQPEPTTVPPALMRAVTRVVNNRPHCGMFAVDYPDVNDAIKDMERLVRTGDYTSAEPAYHPTVVALLEYMDWLNPTPEDRRSLVANRQAWIDAGKPGLPKEGE